MKNLKKFWDEGAEAIRQFFVHLFAEEVMKKKGAETAAKVAEWGGRKFTQQHRSEVVGMLLTLEETVLFDQDADGNDVLIDQQEASTLRTKLLQRLGVTLQDLQQRRHITTLSENRAISVLAQFWRDHENDPVSYDFADALRRQLPGRIPVKGNARVYINQNRFRFLLVQLAKLSDDEFWQTLEHLNNDPLQQGWRHLRKGKKRALLVAAAIILLSIGVATLFAIAGFAGIGKSFFFPAGADKAAAFSMFSGAALLLVAAFALFPFGALAFWAAGFRPARKVWFGAAFFTIVAAICIKVVMFILGLLVDMSSAKAGFQVLAWFALALMVLGGLMLVLRQNRAIGITAGTLGALLLVGTAGYLWAKAREFTAPYDDDAIVSSEGEWIYCRPKFEVEVTGKIVDIWPNLPVGLKEKHLRYRCDPSQPGKAPSGFDGIALTEADNLRMQEYLKRTTTTTPPSNHSTPRIVLTPDDHTRSTGKLRDGECSPIYVDVGAPRFGWSRPARCVWVRINGVQLPKPNCPGDPPRQDLPPIATLQFCALAQTVTEVTVCANWHGTCEY